MGNYGGNVVAAMTQGRLIFVDEPVASEAELTGFETAATAMVDPFIEQFGVDGIYQPGELNRDIVAIPGYV